jgi:hypothetical protein
MIAYRDFDLPSPAFIPNKGRDRENFDRVLAEVNAWVDRESIDVVNVETIIENLRENLRLLRVWYRLAHSEPASSPDV